MPNAEVTYTYTAASFPTKRFTLGYGYVSSDDLTVYKNNTAMSTSDWSLYDSDTVEISGTLVDNDIVRIQRRSTITSAEVDWADGAQITENDLDTNTNQLLYLSQELQDQMDRVDWKDITASYTVVDGDRVVLADATSGAITLTLPLASQSRGMPLKVIKTDSSVNAVTLSGVGAENINGSSTKVLASQYETVEIICDGTEWFVLSEIT